MGLLDIFKTNKNLSNTSKEEDQGKEAFDMFVRALAAAPDSLIKSLTGKEYATHLVEGTKVLQEYLYPVAKK